MVEGLIATGSWQRQALWSPLPSLLGALAYSLPSAGQNIHPKTQASHSAKALWLQAIAVMTLTKNILSIVDLNNLVCS